MSKLDDILTPIFSYGIDWTEHRDKGGLNSDHDVSVFAGQIKSDMRASAKQQIKSMLIELIGEEVYDCPPDCTPAMHYENDAQNELRAELRKKVEQL